MREWIARVQAYALRVELGLIWASLTGFMVVAGPFGLMDALPVPTAVLFWATLIGGVIGLVAMIRAALDSLVPALGHTRRLLLVSAGMMILVPPMVLVVQGTILGTRPNAVRLYLTVAMMTAVIGTIRYVMGRQPPAATEQAERPPTRLAARLPDPNVEILSVSADDHYVVLRTSNRVERVLLRFSDALDELDGLPGLRVHRSHWVARAAVADFQPGSQKSTITLVDGARIPVSRGYRASVETALPDRVA